MKDSNGWSIGYVISKGYTWEMANSYGIRIVGYEQNEVATVKNTNVDLVMNTEADTTVDICHSDANWLFPDTWHHVTGVLEGEQMKIYVDGQLESTLETTGRLSTSDLLLYIGRATNTDNGWQGFFRGLIDDIRIYDRALSDEEILTLYHENGWTGN